MGLGDLGIGDWGLGIGVLGIIIGGNLGAESAFYFEMIRVSALLVVP